MSCLVCDVLSLLESVYHRFTGVRLTHLAAGQAESNGKRARHKLRTVVTHELLLLPPAVPPVVAVDVFSTAKPAAKIQEL